MYLLDRIGKLKLQLLDYNYMCIHNNLHNKNFHYTATILTNKLVIYNFSLQCTMAVESNSE